MERMMFISLILTMLHMWTQSSQMVMSPPHLSFLKDKVPEDENVGSESCAT